MGITSVRYGLVPTWVVPYGRAIFVGLSADGVVFAREEHNSSSFDDGTW